MQDSYLPWWQRWLLQLVRVSGEDKLPQHMAFIMDGNRRYAKKLHHPTLAGHKEGARTLCRLCEACVLLGVKYVTVYGFALGNFHRPPEEVHGLLELAEETFANREWITFFVRNRICLRLLGDLSYLSASLRETLRCAAAETAAACQRAAAASDSAMPSRNRQTPANAAAEIVPDEPRAPVDTKGSPAAGQDAVNVSAGEATATSICSGDEDRYSLLLTICVAYGSRNEMARSLAPPFPTVSQKSGTALHTAVGGNSANAGAATTVSASSAADSADSVCASSVELATANAAASLSTASRIPRAAELADSPSVAATPSTSNASTDTSSCAAVACMAGTPRGGPAAAAGSRVARSSNTFADNQALAGSAPQTVIDLPPTTASTGGPARTGAGAAALAAAVAEFSSAAAPGDTSSSSLPAMVSTPCFQEVSAGCALSDASHGSAVGRKSSATCGLRHADGAGFVVASPTDAAAAAGAKSSTSAAASHAAPPAIHTLISRPAQLMATQDCLSRYGCCSCSSSSKDTRARSSADAYKPNNESPCLGREIHLRRGDGRSQQRAPVHKQAVLQSEQYTKRERCHCSRYCRSDCRSCLDANCCLSGNVCDCDGSCCCCGSWCLGAYGNEAPFPAAVEFPRCLQTVAASPSRAVLRTPYFCEELLHRLLQGKDLDAPHCEQGQQRKVHQVLWRRLQGEHVPPPDLLVRTSGERRLSDFLLYETSQQTHFHFLPVLWPELSPLHVLMTVMHYQIYRVWVAPVRRLTVKAFRLFSKSCD